MLQCCSSVCIYYLVIVTEKVYLGSVTNYIIRFTTTEWKLKVYKCLEYVHIILQKLLVWKVSITFYELYRIDAVSHRTYSTNTIDEYSTNIIDESVIIVINIRFSLNLRIARNCMRSISKSLETSRKELLTICRLRDVAIPQMNWVLQTVIAKRSGSFRSIVYVYEAQ